MWEIFLWLNEYYFNRSRISVVIYTDRIMDGTRYIYNNMNS